MCLVLLEPLFHAQMPKLGEPYLGLRLVQGVLTERRDQDSRDDFLWAPYTVHICFVLMEAAPVVRPSYSSYAH